MICNYLDIKFLTSFCRVSRSFQRLVQPMIFLEFHSGLYDQRNLWKRLELLANALTSRPTLGPKIFYISVKFHRLQHVGKLAQLLRPILQKATNLRSLSLPIHVATADLLDSRTFGYLGQDLKIKAAYDWILGLDEISLFRSSVERNQLYTYHRQDELQLQRLVIGSCALEYRSTTRLLQRLHRLEVVEFYKVELRSCASFSCESKVAGIVKALLSSKNHLKKLALHISGIRDSWTGINKILSFDSFLRLQDLEINEQDLAANAVFPASLTKLVLVDWEKKPSFPFTKDLAKKKLPIHLESITSYSRAPGILRHTLEDRWSSHEVEVHYHRFDDSLPKGSIRVPDSPS
ncbi:hypothetical protein N7509_000072 [Penicillium cosmopolitanum]|uniref:F-box domain-containing protein n=1 Tax=Penicillium cosmopolitanum TaxID=1131564 RepID=A0A9W9WD48_9EURO|nr:uncharacterized protein N7509_000072 [Penicillium cosmopolitanum]KAJ5414974.1 hypothetical protein N7509_000072 [Penicillium cosmopolitanum]